MVTSKQARVEPRGYFPVASVDPTQSALCQICRRLGRVAEARASYRRALELARQEPERQSLARQLARLRH
jgi:predicted RNA polymerase sigma factor